MSGGTIISSSAALRIGRSRTRRVFDEGYEVYAVTDASGGAMAASGTEQTYSPSRLMSAL